MDNRGDKNRHDPFAQRRKTLLLAGAAIAGLFIIIYAVTSTIINEGFIKHENEDTLQNVERAADAINADLSALNSKTGDWANWNDTYTFIEGENPDFIETNPTDTSFKELNINLMLFVNSSGKVVFGKAFDLQNEKEIPVPESLENLSPEDTLIRHLTLDSNLSGIVLLENEPMLIASRPILTSEGEGPIHGTLIFGHYLEQDEIKRLSDVTHLSLTVQRYGDPAMPADFNAAKGNLSENTNNFIQPLSGDSIAGYTILRDVYDKPALILRVDIPRQIYKQGQTSLSYLLASLLAVCLFFGTGTLKLLDRSVRSQMARQESEAKYRALFEEAGDYILVISLKDFNRPVIIDANSAALRHHGYRRDELVGKVVWELNAPGYPKNQKIAEQLQKPGDSVIFETVHVRKDGSTFPVEASIRVFQIGDEIPFALSIERDITERKHAEAQIEHQNKFLKNVFESLTHPFYVIDASSYSILMANPATHLDQLTASPKCYALTHGRDSPCSGAHTCPLEEVKKTKKVVTVEHVHYDRDGKSRNVEVHGFPIFDDKGNVIQIIEYCLDITERRKAEEKLKETLRELTRSNEELERFAHMSAHDLQEPLRMVACYVQLLEKRYRGKLDADADEIIAYAAEGAQRMSKMINDLLAYSSLDKQAKPFAQTDCEAVLEWVLSNLNSAIDESKAEIAHDPLPNVQADDSQLLRVFQNLIDNAIKFRGDAPPRIRVSAEKKGSEWEFSVSDNGIGIEPQYFDRIFMMFHPLNNRNKYPGTGIGLAMCKKIVEHHGGRIWVESEPGKGSTFHFTIPVRGDH